MANESSPSPGVAAVDLARQIAYLEGSAGAQGRDVGDFAVRLMAVMDAVASGAYPDELAQRVHALAERLTPPKSASRRRRKPGGENVPADAAPAREVGLVDAGEVAIGGSDGDEGVEVGDTSSAMDDVLVADHDEEDWPPERVERKLLRQLHAAIAAHVDSGDLVPSLELEIAMENARAALESLWG